MRTVTFILLAATVLLSGPAPALAVAPADDPLLVYRWRDVDGRLHFSNRPERVPSFVQPLVLAPVAIEAEQAQVRAVPLHTTQRGRPAVSLEPGCESADATGVAAAVATRLARSRKAEGLTLLIGSIPVAHAPDTVVTRVAPGDSAEELAAAEQGAIAYPVGGACPPRPPFARYAVGSGRRTDSDGLCDDYRRAFAEVGVAVSRDQGVAQSFRRIAVDFAAVGARGNVAGGPLGAVRLPAWVVEAHVAQAEQIAAETAAFVDELTVALEEIDGAARARGCW